MRRIRTSVKTIEEARQALESMDLEMRNMQRWQWVNPASYTATPASTSQITCANTYMFAAGLPLMYRYGDVVYYGMVASLSEDASITVAGAPLDTGVDLQGLWVGRPEMIVSKTIIGQDTFATVGGNRYINSYVNQANFHWMVRSAYMVYCRAQAMIPSTVTVHLVKYDRANAAWRDITTSKLALAAYPGIASAVNINTTYYEILLADIYDFRTEDENNAGQDFTGMISFVLP